MSRSSCLLALLIVLGCGTEPDTRPQTADYIIEAILVPNCGRAACHSSATRAHHLAFDTIPNALDSMRNPDLLVVPGNANRSELAAVLTESGSPMPPDMPLATADIDLITNWINNGATGFTP
jgi:hypothetical protein